MADVITEIRIEGMRCIESLRLSLRGLTVLIGDNGSGKSTIIEACELLRRASAEKFLDEVSSQHGGLLEMLRHGSPTMTLGVRVEGDGDPLEYAFTIGRSGTSTEIVKELGIACPDDASVHTTLGHPNRFLDRNVMALTPQGEHPWERQRAWVEQHPDRLLLTSYGQAPPHPAIDRVRQALETIEVHVPFETVAHWATPSNRRYSTLRSEQRVVPAPRLELHAANLVNAYLELKNRDEEHWRETMDYVRLGLGPDIDSVQTRASASGGSSALSLKLAHGNGHLLASQLSEGTLAYLAFVALFRLAPRRSLLALDEPDLHLHPQLLMRVLDFMESAAEDYPILASTHSDRLLDGLCDPACVVLCELDGSRATRLWRPDKDALAAWLERYRGLGDIRAAGHQASVISAPLDQGGDA